MTLIELEYQESAVWRLRILGLSMSTEFGMTVESEEFVDVNWGHDFEAPFGEQEFGVSVITAKSGFQNCKVH